MKQFHSNDSSKENKTTAGQVQAQVPSSLLPLPTAVYTYGTYQHASPSRADVVRIIDTVLELIGEDDEEPTTLQQVTADYNKSLLHSTRNRRAGRNLDDDESHQWKQ